MTAEEKSEEYVKTTYCETRSGCDVYRLHDCNEGVCIRCQEFENKKQDYLEGFSDGKQETNTVIAKKNKKLENDLHEAKEIIRKCLDYEKENLYWIADGSDKTEYYKFREHAEKFCNMEPLFYRWVKTGDMCPEQYDIYKGNSEIAYVRFREGVISVHCPDASGIEVYKKVLTDKYPLEKECKKEIEKYLMGLYEDWYSSM